MKKSCPIIIDHFYKTLPAPFNKICGVAKLIYHGENIAPEQRVSLILCSDYYIKKLNTTYRGKSRVTDVLSFTFGETDFLGEIYISLQRAKVQASRFGISYNEEIIRLFVHGMFHLIGFDHETVKERNQMEKKEQKYFVINE